MIPEDRASLTAAHEADLRLARLHVRVGSLGLARAELEAADAEVRWRTGDLAGAGEAADASLAGGAGSSIAAIIAAEAHVASGHTSEARRVLRSVEVGGLDLDRFFAGMPRSTIWPPDPAVPVTSASGPSERSQRPVTSTQRATRESIPARFVPLADLEPPEARARRTRSGPRPYAHVPDPAAELEAAGVDLAAGDSVAAAIRLAVLLRSTPALAPVVLDLLGDSHSPAIEVVRGDALRLVGHVAAAARAYASAAAAINARSPARRPAGQSSRAADIGDVTDVSSDRQTTQEDNP